jgi:predicted nuclease with RNAse H fold
VSRASETCWAGVDVGARKIHGAVVSREALLEGPLRLEAPLDVTAWLERLAPRVVAVDSPRACAPPGRRSRRAERDFARAGICRIRFTPDEETVHGPHRSGYYEWIVNGLKLYAELERAAERTGWSVIECFPTASFTRFGGPRGSRTRAAWSRGVLAGLQLRGLPRRMNQDERDAVMAALTARAWQRRRVERFGELVVPVGSTA